MPLGRIVAEVVILGTYEWRAEEKDTLNQTFTILHKYLSATRLLLGSIRVEAKGMNKGLTGPG